MSYLGMRILLHCAQQVKSVSCERVFMPWFDATQRLRLQKIPLFTLETRTPLFQLDLIGINLQYELHGTNILALLDLGRIPLRAVQRRETDPIILGGGPLSLHPEPFAPFFDAIAIGDGEEVFLEILESLKQLKTQGASRSRKLRALGDIPGVYLPGYYQPRYSSEERYLGLERLDPTLPETIDIRITSELKPEHYPTFPIVPTVEAIHNRLIVEIARGCSRGCRFCGPGMMNRPVRERPIADIVQGIESGLDATGYNEVSLLSLSAADYSRLDDLLEALNPILKQRQVSLSFPSLRPDRFTPTMADRAAAGSRTGLTLALETASPRLRAVINKEVSDEDLLRAVGLAYERGWKSVKLYFMIGLPTETEEDVWAIVDLVKKAVEISKPFGGRGLNVSISPFIPKPHTPFECQGQLSIEALKQRISILKRGLGRFRSVTLEVRNLHVSQVEAAIARGDRRTADAIEFCYQAGGMFDAWTDGFSGTRWEQAFQQAGLDLCHSSEAIAENLTLPWEHIKTGVSNEFLENERDAANLGEFTPDCREDSCNLCGLQQHPGVVCPEIPRLTPYPAPKEKNLKSSEDIKASRIPAFVGMTPQQAAEEAAPPPLVFHRYRLVYNRTLPAQYVSHLDVLGVMERALRRLGRPLEFTTGMKPHLLLVASPPLAVGTTSQAEYLDFGLGGQWSSEILASLQAAFPPGFTALQILPLPQGNLSLGALDTFLYRATPNDGFSLEKDKLAQAILDLFQARELPVWRNTPRKAISFDARPAIWKLEHETMGSLLVGLKSSGGPMPKVRDVLRLLTQASEDEIIDQWHIERLGQWWDKEGRLYSPTEDYFTSGKEMIPSTPPDKGGKMAEDMQSLTTPGGETLKNL